MMDFSRILPCIRGVRQTRGRLAVFCPLCLHHQQVPIEHHLLEELDKRPVVVQRLVELEAHVHHVLDAVVDRVVKHQARFAARVDVHAGG
jgi:hypothetical protein